MGSATEIFELSGLSSGKVLQIIRMSNMRPEIVSHLKGLNGKKALRRYSQRTVQPSKSRWRFFAQRGSEELMTRLHK